MVGVGGGRGEHRKRLGGGDDAFHLYPLSSSDVVISRRVSGNVIIFSKVAAAVKLASASPR